MLNEEMLLKDGWCGVYIYPVDNDKVDREVKLAMEEYELEDFDSVKEDYIERNSQYYVIPKKDQTSISGLIEFVNSDDLTLNFEFLPLDGFEIDLDNVEWFMRDDQEDHWEYVNDNIKNLMCI